MFRLFSRRRRIPTPVFRPVQLSLETLESRFCPFAPMISLNAVPVNSGMLVDLTGMVMDENPAGVTITFSGVVSGQTTANATGQYSLRTTASGLGQVQAVGTDQENLNSNTVNATLMSCAPTITLSVSYGAQKTVTLTGRVTDEAPGNRTVTFTGKVTGTAQTNSDGTFSFTSQASGLGTVSATATDVWGLTSNTANVILASGNPNIINFQAVNLGGGIWRFEGTVVDESPAGLEVILAGLSALTGVEASVDSSGNFSIAVDLEGETGTVSAETTDWWGLHSALAWTTV